MAPEIFHPAVHTLHVHPALLLDVPARRRAVGTARVYRFMVRTRTVT